MKKNIIINLQYSGIHNWPECDIEDVDFLKNPHRHFFHITCKRRVDHNNRDIEFISLKKQIEDDLRYQYRGNFGSMSCEDIAEYLFNQFDLYYCSVLEDGENGAEIF